MRCPYSNFGSTRQYFTSPHRGEGGTQAKLGRVRGFRSFNLDSNLECHCDYSMSTHHAQARALRKSQTDAEAILWSKLRNRQMAGRKFRRQVPLLGYVADFASLDAKLIIELDGGQHAEQVEADERRTRALETAGFLVLRFWNSDVFTNLEAVLETIRATLKLDEYIAV